MLDERCDLHLVFTAKDSGSTYKSEWTHPKDKGIQLDEFRNKIWVVSGIRFFRGIFPRRAAMILREFRQTVYVAWACLRLKPDLIYLDSANVLVGAALARLFPETPVVIRLLGVCSWWWSIIDSNRWIDRLYRYVYRSTGFALVVGTQDGSGTEFWLKKVLPESTARAVMLNGVDPSRLDDAEIEAKIALLSQLKAQGARIILFIGRLESYKGVEFFLSEMIGLLGEVTHRVHIVVIGTGNLLDYSKSKVAESQNQAAFFFFGAVPHKYIINFHELSDIYISTNFDGNLTNANLEAIACDDCILIPKFAKNEYVDRQTFAWLGDSVCFYELDGPNSLKNKTKQLLKNDDEILMYKKRISETKKTFIRTWSQRFDEEYKLLSEIVGNKNRTVSRYDHSD